MRISDWSSDVCSSDLAAEGHQGGRRLRLGPGQEPRGQALRHAGLHAGADPGSRRHGPRRHLACPGKRYPYPGLLNIQAGRSEEHTSELQSLMRISYAVFCLKKKQYTPITSHHAHNTTTTHFNLVIL